MIDVNEITTKTKILVLFANTYDMLTERQEQMKGCSIHYLFWGENGEKLLSQTEWDVSKPVGIQRAKCSIDMSLRTKVPVAPAIYEGQFTMTVGSDGKPVLRLTDISYVANLEVKAKTIPGLVVPGMITYMDTPEAVAAYNAVNADSSDTKTAKTGK